MSNAIRVAVNRSMGFAMDNTANLTAMTRYIPTLSGTQYGEFSSLVTLSSGDSVEFEFATSQAPADNVKLSDGDSASNRMYIYQSATNKLGWNAALIGSMELDGVDAGASLATDYPNDGEVHILKVNISATANFGVIGCAYTLIESFFIGQILSVKITVSSVVTNYVFDSGSTVEQYARGEVAPSGEKCTLTNFAAGNWEKFKYMQNPYQWKAIDGSPIIPIA